MQVLSNCLVCMCKHAHTDLLVRCCRMRVSKYVYAFHVQVLLEAAALSFCVCLVLSLLGVAYLLLNALLGVGILVWQIQWHRVAMAPGFVALASLFAQARLSNCLNIFENLLLWPAAWALLCLQWSSYAAHWAGWVCLLSAADALVRKLSGMLAQAQLARSWCFYEHAMLWLAAWMLLCLPRSLYGLLLAGWTLCFGVVFALWPALMWLRDQKQDKPVQQNRQRIELWQIKGRQQKILHRQQLANVLNPVRFPSLKVRLLSAVMTPFAYAVISCNPQAVRLRPASHILISAVHAVLQVADILLIGACSFLLSGWLVLLAIAGSAMFGMLLQLMCMEFPNKMHWECLLAMRDRFISGGRLAKCGALWSLVLCCNDVLEARASCASR